MKSYTSFSIKLFDTWRILFYGPIILTIGLSLIVPTLKIALITSLCIVFITIVIQLISSYSTISCYNQSIKIKNFSKKILLKNHSKTSTWWSYDFGSSSYVIGEGNVGKTRALSNKINIYVKFEGDGEPIFIYEQIHIGNKFPNNHPYLGNEQIDKNRMIRVWDVDNCLKKLNLPY